MLGRLSSVIAKEILNGQKVVCVRSEDINMSGPLYRNKLKYADFKRKRLATKHSKGHIHYRAPSKILWRTIRGMLPHKTTRGSLALDRLKTFDGVPSPYDEKKRVVVPAALKCLRLKNHRKYCRLGQLSSDFGWKSAGVVSRLEEKRKVKSEEFYKAKLAELKARKQAEKAVEGDFAKKIGKDMELVKAVGMA